MKECPIVIPSFGRMDNVLTKELLPDAVVVVPESQEKAYKRSYENVVSIPDEEDGNIAKKRNAILKRFGKVFMIDDDLTYVRNMVTGNRLNTEDIKHHIFNLMNMAEEMGIGLCGFNHNRDYNLRYKNGTPFSLTRQIYGDVGVLEDGIRYDEKLKSGEDVDFWLQKLRKHRRILRNNYIYFNFFRTGGGEGGVEYGDKEEMGKRWEMLENKWGSRIVSYKKRSAELVIKKVMGGV